MRASPLSRGERATRCEVASAIALVALATLAAPGDARAEALERVERFAGIARGTDGEVVYREDHVVRHRGDELVSAVTVYADAAGRELARLETDFSRNPFAPAYEFRDARTGLVETVRPSDAGVALRGPNGTRTLPLPEDRGRPPLVTGQGLDRLVRDQLDLLLAGRELVVSYAIPSRLATYEFRVRAVKPGAEAPTVRVRAEFTSFVLRLLAPSLEVEYDRETRRLLRYRGVSNLSDASGENPHVEISYRYPDHPNDPGAPAQGPEEDSRASR